MKPKLIKKNKSKSKSNHSTKHLGDNTSLKPTGNLKSRYSKEEPQALRLTSWQNVDPVILRNIAQLFKEKLLGFQFDVVEL
jgi:hypothetical protein